MVSWGFLDRINPFIIPAEGFQLILSTSSCLILKLNSPNGTSFGLYFAYEVPLGDFNFNIIH